MPAAAEPSVNEAEPEFAAAMGFFDHLAELRRRLLYSLGAVAVFCILGFAFWENIYDFISAPMLKAFAEAGLEQRLVFTGPIDEFFEHRHGELPYRSLRFRHETLDREWFQPVATVNYPDEATPYTRITEYKHLTGQSHARTSITYEYPSAEGDPYYPIPRPENQALFKKYEALAASRPEVAFVGRLATYRYYNMDQVTGQALAAWRRLRPVGQAAAGIGEAAIAGA